MAIRRAYGKYFAALLLFGSNGIVASRIALDSDEIVLLRTLIGSLLLTALYLSRGGRPTFHQKKKPFLFLCASGAAMGASWLCLYEAYAQIGVGISSLLYYTGPVLVMALSPFLFRERLCAPKLVGFVLVLCGICLLNGRTSVGSGSRLGILFGILSAILYALMIICNKKAAGITGLENAALQLLAAFLTVALFVGLRKGFVLHIPPSSVLPILVLGLLNTGIGCYCYFSAIGRLPIQTVAVCGYLEPLSAVCFSLLFLRETLSPLQIAGAILMLGGAVLAECRIRGKQRR